MRLASWQAAAILGVGTILGTTATRADEFAVENVSLPIPFVVSNSGSEEARVEGTLEASAVEPIGDGRLLLVAHDKLPGLYVAETATGRLVGPQLSAEAFPEGAKADPKWEGMARDDRGWYYLTGAHNGKTDEIRTNHSHLIRFRLKGGPALVDPIAIDRDSVRRWRIGSGLTDALRKEGLDAKAVAKLKLEGLAVRSGPGRTELVVGLREPGDLVRAFATDITMPPAADAELAFARLFAFPAGSREGVPSQLTSLEYLPGWGGFLVLTATEDEKNAFHGNTLWFVADDQIRAGTTVRPRPVMVFEAAMKAEGLCVLPGTTAGGRSARLVITYDNDVHATQIPSRLQVLDLVRRP